MQVSLYDVSDLTHPVQVDVKTFGGAVSRFDPHAFTYLAGDGGAAGVVTFGTQTGAVEVLRVDPATGFTLVGEVAGSGQVTPWNPMPRPVRIGDYLYCVGVRDIKVVDLMDPGHELATVTLPPPPDGGIIIGLPIFTVHPLPVIGFTPLTDIG
jgi:hypothetical protein